MKIKKNRKHNPSLGQAQRFSRNFHGRDDEVVVLSEKERQLPKHAALMGEVVAIEYAPHDHSGRGHAIWRHESGDRGPGKPRAKNFPWLVMNPKTKRPALVMGKSPMRANAKNGLVG